MFNLANVTFDKVKIRDLVESQYAGEWGDESYFPNANVIRATEIKNDGEINYSTAVKRKIDPQQLERKKLHCGDILVEGSGGSPTQPVGRIAYFNKNSDENFICSNFFRVIRLKSNINSKYIFWLLHYIYFQPIIMRFQQQTTGLINFKFQEYLDLEISVPSSPKDQEYIARVLDNLQNLINLQKDIIRKLVSKKQGLLNDLLTRGVDSHGNLRPSYEDAPDLYQETELGFIPKEWDVQKINAYLVSDAGIKPGPFGSSVKKEFYKADGFKIYGQEQVIAGNQHIGDYYISESKFNELIDFAVKENDILISLVGTIGKVLRLSSPLKKGIINPRLMRLRPNTQLCNPNFLAILLASDFYVNQVTAKAGGGTMPVINKSIISSISVPIIPIDEQMKIVEIYNGIDTKYKLEINNLKKLQKMKKGLLQDLLQN